MPKIVGDYKIIKTLGEGYFSIVKKVINIKNNQEYAMKIINLEDIKNSKMEKQIWHRIELMKNICHPGLVNLHGIMHSKNYLFLIFDLAEGEFFNAFDESIPLSEDLARKYFQQLIDALSYLHSHDCTFRELKSENLLVDKNNNLKIADFIFSNISKKKVASNNFSQEEEEEMEVKSIEMPLRYYAAPEILHEEGFFLSIS